MLAVFRTCELRHGILARHKVSVLILLVLLELVILLDLVDDGVAVVMA